MASSDPTSSTPTDHRLANTAGESYQPRCRTCNDRPKTDSRNLVVCIDGGYEESNEDNVSRTSVKRLFDAIIRGDRRPHPTQCAFYSKGIGTRPKTSESHIFSRMGRATLEKFGIPVAWDVEEIVKEAYGWLARTYTEGDQIYLFGFSRGAYQVRLLARMIHEVGLIKDPLEKEIGMAYELCEPNRSRESKTRGTAERFKEDNSWKDLRVHFIGVWDTVSRTSAFHPGGAVLPTSSAAHACHVRHALALDERRVLFLPEYFHQTNSRTHGKNVKPSETGDIKEVWFAGSHLDIGGKGQYRHAGNVPLMWMREEASSCGLGLEAENRIWIVDDIVLGTHNSMSGWEEVEAIPFKQQVSFSGSGEFAHRFHMSRPRHIIPGQKIHASVLIAEMYARRDTLAHEPRVPFPPLRSSIDDLPKNLWELQLFDRTAARELLSTISRPNWEGMLPIQLSWLLFMLRFPEGKESVRRVPGWRNTLDNLMYNGGSLVKLIAIVAYFEASEDEVRYQPRVLDVAKAVFKLKLTATSSEDRIGVITLLRPLTKYRALRESLLSPDVIEGFLELLDKILKDNHYPIFGDVMECLACLLECDDLSGNLIKELRANPFLENRSRLSLMLEYRFYHDLQCTIASLPVVALVARKEPQACNQLKAKLYSLASRRGQVGLLAVEALLPMYDPSTDLERLFESIAGLNSSCLDNLSRVLNRLNAENNTSAVSSKVLFQLFGLGAEELHVGQERLVLRLLSVAAKTNRNHIPLTMILLMLFKDDNLRKYLLEQKIMELFIDRLRYSRCALLAAYALTIFMGYETTHEYIARDSLAPKYIVDMLKLNYFDDSIGQNEGFRIFSDLMKYEDLRRAVLEHDLTQILAQKLETDKPREIRTSLICLDIFHSFDSDGPWAEDLVKKGLEHLRSRHWKAQKAGVVILSTLVQERRVVGIIKAHICEIIRLLLPSASEEQEISLSAVTLLSQVMFWLTPSRVLSQLDIILPEPRPSSMLGPACVLYTLSAHQTLRDEIFNSAEFGRLRQLWQSGALLKGLETPPWQVYTPNKEDIRHVLDKLMFSAESKEGVLPDGSMSGGDSVLPHIQHWSRIPFISVGGVWLFVIEFTAIAPAIAVAPIVIVAVWVIFYIMPFVRHWWLRRLSRSVDRPQMPRANTSGGLSGSHV
ncbi:hypothetical protein HYDPIDRAFT_118022 [Hydnomerulius pinastri MD-312]|uniref:T6SS Phospholipase effector Tle1-like catalytic domain-containing protein n=1 Tax=Hydnomerulius pinastri MD-312 TaxID=994086 RepID=A0A0C9W9G0_9AGAM|nr:hypothetical protein HYDPIDRAFT_118022 [Hydnomerulius pinastri MD-312]